MGGADPQTVADGDLQRRRRPIVLGSPVHGHRDALDFGSRGVPGKPALPHQMGQGACLRPRAREHRARLLRVLPRVAIPVVDKGLESPLFVEPEMEAASLAPGLDRLSRIPVPKRLRRHHLPGREGRLVGHRLAVREDARAFLLSHQAGPEPRRRRRLPVDMHQDVLEIRPLPADAVHPDTADRIADQPQARPRLHRLLLAGVAREHHLGSVTIREPQDVMRLAGRQHPRLVHHDDAVPVDLDPAPGRELQQLVDAEGAGIEVVAQCHRRPPRHRGGDDGLPVLAVEVGDGPQGGGLARTRRALDDGHTALRASHGADRCGLLPA